MKRTIKRKYHLYFWIFYFLFNVIRWGSYFNDYWYSIKSNLVEFPLHIVLVYFNIYYLVPKFILKKKYVYYIIFLLMSLGVHYLLRSGLNLLLVAEDIWPEVEGRLDPFGFNHIVAVIIGELYVIGLTTAIKFTVDFVIVENKNRHLRELQYKTELKYLKAQIQPHFFFNTLNSLYSLTIKKSDSAPSLVLKLSNFMRYVIYETSKKKLALLDVINHIDNYIELEKMRYGNRVTSEVDITGNIDDVKVVPMLFLPFIENAFKHGLANTDHMELLISFERKEDELIFISKNNFEEDPENGRVNGIGIKNVKRRLELLYPKNFTLDISNKNNEYSILLKIPIK
ncbi:sensor histidine kinase [Aquimarina sp. 2201CG5-10]|uniref:sensor histidine kinase n=1 Tax=Aquimarina callyspongiae TaxID=3098150 RepID=UPI002AB43520|nr:histidine kinase [Aquimarina sp. 2201CG5-10]MDY8135136.1 histidine kinase [Aquimarina sp. 2201CG5-10]